MFTEWAKQIQAPLSRFSPLAPRSDRAAWEQLDEHLRQQLITNGEACLGFPYPVLTATDFMTFSRTGDRDTYQEKLFAKRMALNHLVLAECVENQGRFLDDILNGIYSICGEAAWYLPAHNSYLRDTPQLPLPDVTRPVLELFSAETGAILATVDYVLHDVLEQISPFISAMIQDHLERRIFTPYLTEHFWWMGDGHSPMNNWTIWCTQNVLLASFLGSCPDPERKAAIFQKACQSVDYFLAEYGEDGCCDEGAQYYRHAGLCLFGTMEILNGITGNAFLPLFENSKIRNIAAYIMNVHVDGPYYINFSDCSPIAGRCNAREFLFGKRVKHDSLMRFAAADYQASEDPLLTREHNLFYRLQTVFAHKEMMAVESHKENPPIEYADIYYDSVGLFLARDNHYCLAVKAGDNDDSHNHNDTGSFTIYKNGRPLFIDVGVETYTKKTFSPDRYEIWTMQSQYHNLPSFGEEPRIMQMNGPDYHATAVTCQLGDDCSHITLDIAGAYPDNGIQSYLRYAQLEKGRRIVIEDTYHGNVSPVTLSLMTCEAPRWEPETSTLFIGDLGLCQLEGAAAVTIEQIPIRDARLETAWPHDIYRTLVEFEMGVLKLIIC